jgi:hypothetical protein
MKGPRELVIEVHILQLSMRARFADSGLFMPADSLQRSKDLSCTRRRPVAHASTRPYLGAYNNRAIYDGTEISARKSNAGSRLTHATANLTCSGVLRSASIRSATTLSASASTLDNASARLFPYASTPGRLSISAIHRPSSSRSKTISNSTQSLRQDSAPPI